MVEFLLENGAKIIINKDWGKDPIRIGINKHIFL